jgi:hypothetical protein
MGQHLTLELSDSVYRVLAVLARASGRSPDEWAVDRLRPHLRVSGDESEPPTVAPELVHLLRSVAARTGRTYEEVAASFMRDTAPRSRPKVSRAEAAAALERLWEHTVDLGHPTGADNESIDADLARAYGDNHEWLDAPKETSGSGAPTRPTPSATQSASSLCAGAGSPRR